MRRLQEYVTSGFVRHGDLLIRNQRGYERALAQFADGEVVLTIERRHARRSKAQNAYWWGVCVHLVSEHTGYSPDEVHDLAKQMFLPKKLALCDGNGEVKGEFVIGGTTTKLNKIEFSDYCETIRKWAAEELDVNIPDPEFQ